MARLKVRWISYATLFFLLLLYVAVMRSGRRKSALIILDALCQEYKEGKVTGGYCEKVCSFKSRRAFAYSTSDKAVLLVEADGKQFLLKSAKQFLGQFDMVPEFVSVAAFTSLLDDRIRDHVGLFYDASVSTVKSVWSNERTLSLADRRSIWALTSQAEYLNFKLLDFTELFPKVAEKFVHTLRALEYSHAEPLHWCDASSLNLGIGVKAQSPYLILDADMLFTDTGFGSFMAKMPCQRNSDCDFFDCKAYCNRTAQVCSGRVNSNLQVVCEKFVPWWYKAFFGSSDRLVALCSNGSFPRSSN